MQIAELKCKLQESLKQGLPGFSAQAMMSPPFRGEYTLDTIAKYNPKESAVLLLVYEKEGVPHVVFTQRHEYKGAHSGQISLPGGKQEPEDDNEIHTALREANEEIGIDINSVEVLGPLTWLYVPPSNFVIRPIIAFTEYKMNFIPEELEVKEILEIPLHHFLHEKNKIMKEIIIQKPAIQFSAPAYKIGDNTIWGATAMIVSEFVEIINRKH